MQPGHCRARQAVVGIAGAGLLLGHWLTYQLRVPAGARTQVLADTGHGYLPAFGRFAVLAAVVSIAVLFLGRLTRREEPVGFASIAGPLVALQAAGFFAMEVAERVGAGAGLHDLASILPLGLAVQAGLALAGAWVLRAVLRAAASVPGSARPITIRRPRPAFTLLAPPLVPPAWTPARVHAGRGPPPGVVITAH